MKLLLGACAKEIVLAVSECDPREVGLTISSNQSPGYCGWTPQEIRDICPDHYIQRDHMKVWDVPDCWDGAFIDSDDPSLYRDGLRCEVGAGEDPRVDIASRIAMASGCKIEAVSVWCGQSLTPQGNVLKCIGLPRQLRWPLRMHNADYLSLTQLRWLQWRGVQQFNIAPQAGLEVTLAYDWIPVGNEDRPWGPHPVFSGHYTLNDRLPDRDLDKGKARVLTLIRSILQCLSGH